MSRIHYVYKTTNLINNMYYIGKHSFTPTTNNLLIDSNYYGSGKLLAKDIKHYGKHNFKVQVLQYCKTENEAYQRQKQIVTEDLVLDQQCYNLTIGGKFSDRKFNFDVKNSTTEEMVQRILKKKNQLAKLVDQINKIENNAMLLMMLKDNYFFTAYTRIQSGIVIVNQKMFNHDIEMYSKIIDKFKRVENLNRDINYYKKNFKHGGVSFKDYVLHYQQHQSWNSDDFKNQQYKHKIEFVYKHTKKLPLSYVTLVKQYKQLLKKNNEIDQILADKVNKQLKKITVDVEYIKYDQLSSIIQIVKNNLKLKKLTKTNFIRYCKLQRTFKTMIVHDEKKKVNVYKIPKD